MLRIALLFILIIIINFVAYGQSRTIQGTVKNEFGEVIQSSTVLIKQDSSLILFYKSTDESGKFEFVLPATVEGRNLQLEISHLGYGKTIIPIIRSKNQYDISLEVESFVLKDVKIGNRPRIDREGDTLYYNVQSFSDQTDRSIGDVLKRMPGIEVAENGKISFNGQTITSLYIDGDDLLEGKYGIGTRSIPYAMVQDVEVLKNHQPLKVLKDRVFSTDVAMNLVIKDDAKLKLSGEGTLGGGLPEQYFAEFNTMLFNKKYKMLNILKANNNGTDFSDDLTDLIDIAAYGAGVESLLSSGNIGAPSLGKSRYYRNNSGALLLNNLANLSKGWQIKSNINLMLDRNRIDYNSFTEVYTGKDTISYFENLANVNKPFVLDANVRAQKNTDHVYVNNTFLLRLNAGNELSSLNGNQGEITQRLNADNWLLRNQAEFVPKLSNNSVLSIKWKVNYGKLPEKLSIMPGTVSALDLPEEYSSVQQQTEIQSLRNDVEVSYHLAPKWITQQYTLQAQNEFQRLNSSILLGNDGINEYYKGMEEMNGLRWEKHLLRFNSVYGYKSDRSEVTLRLPLAIQQISYKDANFDLNQKDSKFLFNPTLFAKLKLGLENEVDFSYGFLNLFGNIYDVFRGSILTTYRTLMANESMLQERSGHRANVNFRINNSASMLFVKVGGSYNYIHSNSILSSVISENVSKTVLLPMKNNTSRFSLNTGLSKFIFALNAKSSLDIQWSSSRTNQLINEVLMPFRNNSFILNPSFDTKIGRINLTYMGWWTWSTNTPVQPDESLRQQLFSLRHHAGITCSPVKNIFLSLKGEQLLTQQNDIHRNYFFVDVNLRYKYTRARLDFQLDLRNLANVKNYESLYLEPSRLFYSEYRIRGREGMLKVTFNF